MGMYLWYSIHVLDVIRQIVIKVPHSIVDITPPKFVNEGRQP
jgi:hypothetical protein